MVGFKAANMGSGRQMGTSTDKDINVPPFKGLDSLSRFYYQLYHFLSIWQIYAGLMTGFAREKDGSTERRLKGFLSPLMTSGATGRRPRDGSGANSHGVNTKHLTFFTVWNKTH
jgi:hypothetical protein